MNFTWQIYFKIYAWKVPQRVIVLIYVDFIFEKACFQFLER